MIVASVFAPRAGENRWGADYDALLMLLDASCRRLGLRHVVISDAPRPAPLDTAVFDLPDNLMALLLDAQRQFLAVTPGPVLLVGADCLVTRDPRPFLHAALTVTIGPFSDCPMNTGAIWCSDGPTCAPIWAEALKRWPRRWGQDQTALWDAIQASQLPRDEMRAEIHNWAPEHVDDPAGRPTVVHFRGRRKAFMADWARRHLGLEVAA